MQYIITTQEKLLKLWPHTCTLKDIDVSGTIQVDTETTGLSHTTDRVFSLQIGNGNEYIIDMESVSWDEVRHLLQGKMILHNAKFDLPFMMKQGIYPIAGNVIDTQIQERCLTLGKYVPTSLGYTVKKYTKQDIDKSSQSTINKGYRTLEDIKYGFEDVKHLLDIHGKQVQSAKTQLLDLRINSAFSVVLAYIEHCGIYLNEEAWRAKMRQDQQEVTESLQELNAHCRKEGIGVSAQYDLFSGEGEVKVDWNSPAQVSKIFLEEGIDLKYKGKDTVSEKHLSKYKDLPLISLYIKYKKKSKEATTYGQKFLTAISPSTNRIHTSFNQLVATGRLSCGKKGDKKKRTIDLPNLQNVPRKGVARQCFVPEEGNIYVVCDYSSQESRLLADLTKDQALLEFFHTGGGNLHSYTAKKVWPNIIGDTPIEEVEVLFPEYRQNAKSVNFAISYGGTASTIAENANIPLDEAQDIYDAYLKAFPGIAAFFEVNMRNTLTNGYILLNPITGSRTYPLWKPYGYTDIEEVQDSYKKGYVLAVPYLKSLQKIVEDDKFERDLKVYRGKERGIELQRIKREYNKLYAEINRKSTNYLIQGTAALQTKLAGILLYEELRKRGWLGTVKIVNVIHDEYVLECPINMGEEVKVLLQDCMIKGGNYFMEDVVMEADAYLIDRWAKK